MGTKMIYRVEIIFSWLVLVKFVRMAAVETMYLIKKKNLLADFLAPEPE